MNKQIEALKMAIEALENDALNVAGELYLERKRQYAEYPKEYDYYEKVLTTLDDTIQACKEALAEAEKQEHQLVFGDAIHKGLSGACINSQKQEPVAWIEPITKSLLTNEDAVNNEFCNLNSVWKPLYTHPATWKSLSDDEIVKALGLEYGKIAYGHIKAAINDARAIEQTLKELNAKK